MNFKEKLSAYQASKNSKVPERPSEEVESELLAKLRKGRKATTSGDAEMRRICDLPICPALTEEEIEQVNRRVVLAEAYESGWRLLPAQARALHTLFQTDTLFGPIGVGGGKTGVTLKAADHFYFRGARKIMLLMPPDVYGQLVKRDIPWARTKMSLGVPFHRLGRQSPKKRKRLVESGRPGCYLFPYSLLSVKDTDYLLEAIAPEVIIADECHKLKNLRAARTRRLHKYVVSQSPRFLAVSGTITSRGVGEYHHLIRAALGGACPLPRNPVQAGEWGAVIDSEVEYASFEDMRPLEPLLGWARAKFFRETFDESVAGYRSAYRHRLVTAPGVVATSDQEIGTGLLLHNRPVSSPEAHEGFAELEALAEQVQKEFVTPNGDDIDHAIHTFKWLYELSAGFYNELTWPKPEVLARRRGITLPQAEDALSRARDHHEAKQEYTRELRQYLNSNPSSGLDTPLLVGLEISRHGAKKVPSLLVSLWEEAKSMEFEDMPEREGRVVRVCDYKIKQALKWAQALPKGTGGIIWVHHKAVAEWAVEVLKEAGLPVLNCPAGSAAGEAIMDPENRGAVAVASMRAHGTGKNLQHFHQEFFLQWPRPAKEAEQVLGRTHRTGQMADTVEVTTCHTLQWDQILFAATLNDSIYITQTTGQRQKLLFADYNPLPAVYSSQFLLERGMQNRVLSDRDQQEVVEKFGEVNNG